MACFRPIDAWQLDGGEIVFVERGRIRRSLTLPCGRCVGCRAGKARSWAIRCMHEAQMWPRNAFVTLTYRELKDPGLNYQDYQGFMKRFRRAFGPVRFYMCGEYGEQNFRPHFHALLFGWYPSDTYQVAKDLVSSRELERVWPYGFNTVGQVTYQSAGYVARYVMKKAYGVEAQSRRYSRVDPVTGECYQVAPEFARMSLKPGIGFTWFQKYWRDVYMARDGVVLDRGRTVKAPRYYDNLLESLDFDLRYVKDLERYLKSAQFASDCTPERLKAREIVAKAKENRSRSL